jgi:uncharacterized protein with HEPN domain/predicted nucleotidyltransferase
VTFGEALARRRKAAALTQAQLARRVGTSQGRISSYESGRLIPSPASQDRLLRAARRLPSQVLDEKRDEVKHLAASERLLAVRVFGSVARGDDTLSSDIDLLVTPAPEATLLNLARFQIGAESLTGYQVDVVTDRGLDPSSDILAGALELSHDQPRRGRGPGGGLFVPIEHPEADIVLSDDDADYKREARLERTLAETGACFRDAAEIVARGKDSFFSDHILQRAAKNIIAELAETIERLPRRVRDERPDIPWQDIRGMRNFTVHQYRDVDSGTVWRTLADDFPKLQTSLRGIRAGS